MKFLDIQGYLVKIDMINYFELDEDNKIIKLHLNNKSETALYLQYDNIMDLCDAAHHIRRSIER